jgi:hypothetical protein
LFKHFGVFDTVKVNLADQITKGDLERLKFGAYLTLSITGSSKTLTKNIEMAHELGLTCINIVNAEDSEITRVISEKGFSAKLTNDFDDSITEDASTTLYDNEESIGMYTKFGFCYSDFKAFVPQVIAMALAAIWFSDAKTTAVDKEAIKAR